MPFYKKKPVVIEAVQWNGWVEGMTPEVAYLLGDGWDNVGIEDYGKVLVISTLEGDMRANVGDWIIKGVQGEFYPCKPDIFEATYNPVGAAG